MAKHPPQEDFFDGTTMTFGDHLEELRVSLTRALIGLTIGSVIGLIFANHVVAIIQRPLISALGKHYAELAEDKLKAKYGSNLDGEMMRFAKDWAFVFDEVYVERELLERLVDDLARRAHRPQQPGNRHPRRRHPRRRHPRRRPRQTANLRAANLRRDRAAPLTAVVTPQTETLPSETDAYAKMEAALSEVLPSPKPDMIKIRMWRPAKARLTTLSPHESFMIWVKAGIVAGLLLSSPYVFYQIWIFVAAGLYPHEKKYVHLYLPFSLILFLSGAALAFFFVFGPVLSFLFSFSRLLNIEPDLRISEVISFVLFLPLGFGVAFQLPLVMLFVHRIGLISIETYIEKWRVAILLIFVVSMLLTPSDPYSMLLMAGPLTGLYFLGLGLCKWMPRGKNPFTEAYDP